jgi:hypothetical protein
MIIEMRTYKTEQRFAEKGTGIGGTALACRNWSAFTTL